MQDFNFLACREVAEKFVVGWGGGGGGFGQFLGSALVKLDKNHCLCVFTQNNFLKQKKRSTGPLKF